jgi:SagB-type dehydrogenase family enzyme
MTPHSMDWQNQPSPYKAYPGLPGIQLPDVRQPIRRPLEEAFRERGSRETALPNLSALSAILFHACALTARARQPGGDFHFRSAPSAGALYPNVLYLLWPGTPELAAGVYHYGFNNRRLTRIRDGDGGDAAEDAVFAVTGIFFRSAWKYRSRAYRYLLLDAGHLLENLRLAASAAGFLARPAYDFPDSRLDALLGVDPEREGALACLQLNPSASFFSLSPYEAMKAPGVDLAVSSRTAEKEVSYPSILEIHEAARQVVPEEKGGDGQEEGLVLDGRGAAVKQWIDIPDMAHAAEVVHPERDYADAVLRRRSERNFSFRSMNGSYFSYMIDLLRRCADASRASGTLSLGLLVERVEGVAPGFYLLERRSGRLGMVFEGTLMHRMSAICLNQAWLSGACLHVLMLSNPGLLDTAYGARGYRYAMLEAGRIGHGVYLGASALGLGCCGIGAFYDEEARSLLGLAPEWVMLYLVAAGPVKSKTAR